MNYTVSPIKNLEIVLNNQRNPYLNWATHKKNTCQILLPPQKSTNRKFQTQTNPFIIPVTWNPEYPPWVPPSPSTNLAWLPLPRHLFWPTLSTSRQLKQTREYYSVLGNLKHSIHLHISTVYHPWLGRETRNTKENDTLSPFTNPATSEPLNYCLTSTSSSTS